MIDRRKGKGPDGAATPNRALNNGCGTQSNNNPGETHAQGCPLSRCPFSILSSEGVEATDMMVGLRRIANDAFHQRMEYEHGGGK